MSDKPLKRVFIVDDEHWIVHDLREVFLAYNDDAAGAFTFEVDTTQSVGEAIERVRAEPTPQYDVLVLDLSFNAAGRDRQGMKIAEALAIYRRLGQPVPVEILFTGWATVGLAVEAMRAGMWDVIDKAADEGDRDPFEQVLDSAVARLQGLALQERLNEVVVPWLQQHIVSLQTKYGGKLVAIWHEPTVAVIASGKDAFELEKSLQAWRWERESWMYPFVVQIPDVSEPLTQGDAR
jgi:CheY-like chemotaxis protein